MKKIFYIPTLILCSLFLWSCEEERPIYDDEVLVTLQNSTGDYYVEETNNTYTLPVWLLRPSSEDIQVSLEIVEDDSDAVEGEDFTIVENPITIPAGELMAEFEIRTDFENASVEGKNVTFQISSEDVGVTQFRTSFDLAIKKACALTGVPGTFDVVSEFWGDFTTEVVAGQAENQLILEDYYAEGTDITITVNEDFTVTVPKQNSWVSGTYGQASLASRPGSKIDPCNGVITLVLEHTVSAGTFGVYTDVLERQDGDGSEDGSGDGSEDGSDDGSGDGSEDE